MSATISTWFARHLQALFSSLGQLARTPVATTLTVAVMALALALPLSLLTLVNTMRSATGSFSGAISLSAYLKADVSEQRAQQLSQSVRGHQGVASVNLVTATDALRDFRNRTGFGAALDALDSNPLPHMLAIKPDGAHSDPASTEQLRRFLAGWPDVELVQLDSEWVTRFNAILGVMRAVLLVIAVLLGAAVVAVVGNTIRLEILNRRAEIEVTKLVGGTNAFVRRPFLYTGVIYGVLAALLAWLIVTAALLALRGPAEDLARAYGSGFRLALVGADAFGALAVAGLAVGWLGAWLATARHLARIEPHS
jgi:cell division transport system permease protein